MKDKHFWCLSDNFSCPACSSDMEVATADDNHTKRIRND
jgi:hypothetical protein